MKENYSSVPFINILNPYLKKKFLIIAQNNAASKEIIAQKFHCNNQY